MKGDKQVIEMLNKALKLELTAVNQFFLHARILDDWGFESLGKKMMEESVEEMRHADTIIQRILLLEGHPNLQDLAGLRIGETVKEMHEVDLKTEYEASALYNAAITLCEEKKDYVTRELFTKILSDEEEHIDWLETRLSLIKNVGEQNYLQSIM
ncbi:MAG: bacterioferritin [Alphaproteobacteria bacterium]|nr:bacterioferritin [Alphaproteobacteria bacterium]